MKKFILLLTFLVSCYNGKINYDKTHNINRKRTFYDYLAENYNLYSDFKKERYDWRIYKEFKDRGRKSALQKKVEPLVPEKWFLIFKAQNVEIDELIESRERLISALSEEKIKKTNPKALADSQFFYDCWVLEEISIKKYAEVAKCKSQFLINMEKIDNLIVSIEKKENLININSNNQLMANIIKSKDIEYNIYFDFDSYKINREASREISKIIKKIRELPKDEYKIYIYGNADRVGRRKYNESLAKKRVFTIRNAFIKNGISSFEIETLVFGERRPQIITMDNKKEQLNRRVNVVLQKRKAIDFNPLPIE